MHGQRGIPKFKNDGLKVYSEKDESGKLNIFIESLNPHGAIYNEEDDTILIKTTKTPYVPVQIMKILFKIGYSFLSESELKDYLHVEKMLNTSMFDDKLTDYCKVLKLTFPNRVENPLVITYKKREEYNNYNIPTKIVLLYCGRFMFQYVLLNSTDKFMIEKGGEGKVFYCPPYWAGDLPAAQKVIVDFSNPKSTKEEESYLLHL